MSIERVRGDSPLEDEIGFSGAVVAGDQVFVSGTLPLVKGTLQGESDPYEQALAAFRNALGVLAELDLGPESVVRTRIYLTHARDVDAVSRAHKQLFDAARPAMTLVVVSGLVDSQALVEVELEAYAPRASRAARATDPPGDATARQPRSPA